MSLAVALMAVINGSTGSWATLSHGLSLPHHASPARPGAPRILILQGWRRTGLPGTLSRKSLALSESDNRGRLLVTRTDVQPRGGDRVRRIGRAAGGGGDLLPYTQSIHHCRTLRRERGAARRVNA